MSAVEDARAEADAMLVLLMDLARRDGTRWMWERDDVHRSLRLTVVTS